MGRSLRLLIVAVLTGLSPALSAATGTTAGGISPGNNDESVRRLISLVEYIGGDYKEAVQGGQIINDDEFKEMQNFVASALNELSAIGSRLPADAAADVKGNLNALSTLIDQKGDYSAIKSLTTAVKNRVIDSLKFDTTPQTPPDEATARVDYGKLCASCHGESGMGDGPASPGMEPPPRNFHDADIMAVSSPFKFYNTLVLGVEGTSMVSYAKTMSDQQLWSLAFYVTAVRYGAGASETAAARWSALSEASRTAMTRAGLSLALLARASDGELQTWLKSSAGVAEAEIPAALRALRTAAPYLADVPRLAEAGVPSGESGDDDDEKGVAPSGADLDKAMASTFEHVRTAKERFAAGDFSGAEGALLDGYLHGFEGLETALNVTHAALVVRVEQGFIATRQAAAAGERDSFDRQISQLDGLLSECRDALGKKEPLSAMSEFFASLVIILREGFEAFLIVGALLTLLTKTGAARVKRWVHAGWISAIVAGFASYYLFTLVFQLSGADRETIEAVATGAAAVVLFYVSFWLLNQAERSRWERYIKDSVKLAAGPSGKALTLFFLSFIAVYREAAETVLFYQALAASSSSTGMVAIGFLAGCALLLIVCSAIMRYGIRLPLRQFFLVTSSVMIGISIILAGKAVHELIEAGYVQPTVISPFPTIDALGIYPNWESLGVQLVAVALAAGIGWYSVRSRQAQDN